MDVATRPSERLMPGVQHSTGADTTRCQPKSRCNPSAQPGPGLEQGFHAGRMKD